MRVGRVIVLLLFVVVALGGFSCHQPPPQPSAIESKAIVISPTDEGGDTCLVLPFKREMGPTKWVTFVNSTAYDVDLKLTADTVVGGYEETLKPDESVTLKLSATGPQKDYEYSVTADCYTPVLPGPWILIP